MRGEEGATTVFLLGVTAIAVLLALVVADVGGYITSGIRAATAADAAALAAAPVTFRSFGPASTPVREARRFAAANGASLVSCRCRVDASWRTRTIEVIVETSVRLALFGRRSIRAIGRAEFVPTRLN